MTATPTTIQVRAAQLGIQIPTLFLPRAGTDLTRWAVVACDQYTSQPKYWQNVEEFVGDAPSALRLVLPEIYLEHPGTQTVADRVGEINQTMARYLYDGTLAELPAGVMVIDRKTPLHPSRKGLLLAIDLETYDFRPGNRELTRATEGTVLDRIPPRQAVRRDAWLELPHVQLLIDDPNQTVIEPLYDAVRHLSPLYQTDLMQDGGSVTGWHVAADSPILAQAIEALYLLDSLREFGLLFAVGDGNHSLATAKAHWDSIKKDVAADHPARYALTEIINIHDKGLDFEPIHRAVFNLDFDLFVHHAQHYFAKLEANRAFEAATITHTVALYGQDRSFFLQITLEEDALLVGSVQAMLDDLIDRHPKARLDYIHGEDVVHELAHQGAIGLMLPALNKADFFGIIARDGILPRKTFSMGESFEKRFYLEARKIR